VIFGDDAGVLLRRGSGDRSNTQSTLWQTFTTVQTLQTSNSSAFPGTDSALTPTHSLHIACTSLRRKRSGQPQLVITPSNTW
jgi:hypothetical protein